MSSNRASQSIQALRILAACLMLVHGIYRAMTEGFVPGFGEYLTSVGVPAGGAVAIAITAWEIVGGLWLLSGRAARIPALLFALELTVGMIMVHLPEGWFVVGGGRNGMEYSALLIATMLGIAWAGGGRRDDVTP